MSFVSAGPADLIPLTVSTLGGDFYDAKHNTFRVRREGPLAFYPLTSPRPSLLWTSSFHERFCGGFPYVENFQTAYQASLATHLTCPSLVGPSARRARIRSASSPSTYRMTRACKETGSPGPSPGQRPASGVPAELPRKMRCVAWTCKAMPEADTTNSQFEFRP